MSARRMIIRAHRALRLTPKGQSALEPPTLLPAPMPAHLADGTRVWLHYEPLRWERHP